MDEGGVGWIVRGGLVAAAEGAGLEVEGELRVGERGWEIAVALAGGGELVGEMDAGGEIEGYGAGRQGGRGWGLGLRRDFGGIGCGVGVASVVCCGVAAGRALGLVEGVEDGDGCGGVRARGLVDEEREARMDAGGAVGRDGDGFAEESVAVGGGCGWECCGCDAGGGEVGLARGGGGWG